MLLMIAGTLSAQQDSVKVWPIDTVNGTAVWRYKAEKSIGLYRISKNFGVTQEEIIKWNPQLRDRGLHVDEELLIPVSEEMKKIAEAAKQETPKQETPAVETPKQEIPIIEVPKKDTVVTEAPKQDTTITETPKRELPNLKELPSTATAIAVKPLEQLKQAVVLPPLTGEVAGRCGPTRPKYGPFL